jgi:hypothetical protein
MEMKRWDDGIILSQSLCGLWRTQEHFFVKTAYCLHELCRTEEAKKMLLYAPTSLRETALFNYNLACYETQLGNLEQAKVLLKTCFEKDKDFREEALDDPDLAPLWDSIES